MTNTLTRFKTALRSNKGFSLIELIIVIAIMAALIAILAPQYLKYVEKSRVTADVATATEIVNAVKVVSSDPDLTIKPEAYTFTWPVAGGTLAIAPAANATTNSTTEITAALTEAMGSITNLPKMKSSTHTAAYVVHLTVTAATTTTPASVLVTETGW